MIFYNYSFNFLDSQGSQYLLRKSEITAVKVLYRTSGTTDSYTNTLDFNIDEKNNSLWVRLPTGDLELVFTLNVQPLRTLTTGATTFTFGTTTASYDVTATPVPLNSLQGYSPRIIGGYWYEYDDDNQAFYNTGIAAAGTVISETTQVDDSLALNDMNPVTSNAVKKRTDELQQQVTENATELSAHDTALQALEEHKNSVTINGVTTEEDTAGNINLGENISAADIVTVTTEKDEITSAKENEDGPLGNICLQEGATLLNGEIVGGKYGRHFICHNSPTLAYYIFDVNSFATSFYIQISFNSDKIAGHIFLCTEDYNQKIYTDNPLLCNYIYDNGVYYNPNSGGMQTNIWIYADNFANIPTTVTNYAGDVSRLKKILYGQNAKSWTEVRATPYVIDSFRGELDLSVNIPAVTLTLPTTITYPQTIVVKNIQGAACTLSATGYTDMVLDDQTINYITLTSPTVWTKVSTKNEAGAQGVKIGDDATVYPVDAQGIINLPTQADGNTVMIDMATNTSLNPQEIVNGTHYIGYNGISALYLHGTNPTCVVTVPKTGDTVLLELKNGDGQWSHLRACTEYSDNYIVNGALVGYYEYGDVDMSNYYTKTDIDTKAQTKQDQLTAGDNITIVDNVISSTGGSGSGDVTTVGLTTDYLPKASAAKAIIDSAWSEGRLNNLKSIIESLTTDAITLTSDTTFVANNVTYSANTPVTTTYDIASISASGATVEVLHGNPHKITDTALANIKVLNMRYAYIGNNPYFRTWLSAKTGLETVVLPEDSGSVTYGQFFETSAIKNVTTFNNTFLTATSLWEMCLNCTSLLAFTIGRTPVCKIMGEAFRGCSSLTTLNLTNAGSEILEDASALAKNCTSLETLNLTNFNFGTSDCSQMLYGCVSLKNLTLKGAKTEGISGCRRMFYNCSSLVTLSFGASPMFTAASVDCEYMFDGCKALTTLDVSTFLPASISSCSFMFDNCTAMNSLALPTGWCNTVDLGYMVALSQSSIAAIATALAAGVTDKVITFDATIYAAIPAAVLTTISDKGWTVSTVTY